MTDEEPARPSILDLGWVRIDANNAIDGAELAHAYWSLKSVLSEGHSVRVRLVTPWVLSDLQDTLPTALLLHPRVVIECPRPAQVESRADWAGAGFVSGTYEIATWDERRPTWGASWCDYSFLDAPLLAALCEEMDLSTGEVLVLPSFRPGWEEPRIEEYIDSDTGEVLTFEEGSPPNPFEVEALMRPFNDVWPHLLALPIMSSAADVAEPSLSIPLLKNIKIRDLLRLRQDERDSFSRWLEYASPLLDENGMPDRHFDDAVRAGLRELEARLKALKRKGTLETIGAVLTSSSAAIALVTADKPLALAGALTAAGGFAARQVKALYEIRDGRRVIRKEPQYFMWLVNR